MLVHSDPDAAKRLLAEAQEDVLVRWRLYERWAALSGSPLPEAPK
jgi:hypothetical protein